MGRESILCSKATLQFVTVEHAAQAKWVRGQDQKNGIPPTIKIIEASSTTLSSYYLQDGSIDTQ
jgi:hypothetical protein